MAVQRQCVTGANTDPAQYVFWYFLPSVPAAAQFLKYQLRCTASSVLYFARQPRQRSWSTAGQPLQGTIGNSSIAGEPPPRSRNCAALESPPRSSAPRTHCDGAAPTQFRLRVSSSRAESRRCPARWSGSTAVPTARGRFHRSTAVAARPVQSGFRRCPARWSRSSAVPTARGRVQRSTAVAVGSVRRDSRRGCDCRGAAAPHNLDCIGGVEQAFVPRSCAYMSSYIRFLYGKSLWF